MLTHEDVKRLAAISGPCLTILQPLRGTRIGSSKPEALEAAILEGGRLLEDKGFSAAEREEMLRPLMKVATHTDWTSRNGSVAMFRAPDFTMVNFWPDAVPARVRFGTEFLVLPLLQGLLTNRDYWLLALSINAVRLFRGSSRGFTEWALPDGVPRKLAGFPGAGRSEERKGVHPGAPSTHEVKAEHLHDFFKAVDRGIQGILAQDPQPLILAAVSRELAVYRRVNTYSPMLAGAIHGSPESLGTEKLCAEASKLMSAYSAQAAEATLREMEEAAGRALMATDPAAVIDAARAGQIEELIVSPEAPGFSFREDAINWAALATIRNSGKISILNAPQMPEGMAAILRYRNEESAAPEFMLTALSPQQAKA
jgi:hypothetical protein